MDIRTIMVDPDASKDGVWTDYVNGIRVKIARWFNPVHEAAYHRRLADITGGAREATDEEALVNAQALAEGVVTDWSGIEEDGVIVARTLDTALKYMTDPRLVLFMRFIQRRSQDLERYRLAAAVSAAGN